MEALAKCEESLVFSRTCGGRIQAGVTLQLMGKIRLQEQRCADALQYVQEAMTIFKETGSRHLLEAEATLKQIQEKIELRQAQGIWKNCDDLPDFEELRRELDRIKHPENWD